MNLGASFPHLYNRNSQWKFPNQKSNSKDVLSARTDLLPKEFRPGGFSLAHSLTMLHCCAETRST